MGYKAAYRNFFHLLFPAHKFTYNLMNIATVIFISLLMPPPQAKVSGVLFPSPGFTGGIAKTASDCKYSRLSYQQTHQDSVVEFAIVLKLNRNSLGNIGFHARPAAGSCHSGGVDAS